MSNTVIHSEGLAKLYHRGSQVDGGLRHSLKASIDDYGAWPGCRRAVNEFFRSHALSYPLQRVDETAHWFQKS
jgi:hypothetical protein